MKRKKENNTDLTLKDVAEANWEFREKFLQEIPYNAWRFFGLKSYLQIDDGHISLNSVGDSFSFGDPDFMECLEFWVHQFGGKITWEES